MHVLIRPYKAPFAVGINVNKCKDAVLNYNCMKLTVIHQKTKFATVSPSVCHEVMGPVIPS